MRRALAGFAFLCVVGACGGSAWPGGSESADSNGPTTSIALRATTSTKPPAVGASTTSSLPIALAPIDEAGAAAGNDGLFDYERPQLEPALRAQPDPKLTGFTFDTNENMVRVDFAYGHPARETRPLYDDFAWKTAKTLANAFWLPELVETIQDQHGKAAWLPVLRVQLDDISYVCPPAVEIEMAKSGLTKTEWLAECPAQP